MKTKIEQLRADMMTNGVFTRHERRQMKYLTKANEAQRQYVRAALPANHLAGRWMDTCGDVDHNGNIDYCGVPLCPRCHMRERGVQTGKAVKKIFCDAANDELAFATILLPLQLDFSGMTALVENEKRRLRTFIDRQRKKDARWNDFQLLGWLEIDRMRFGDYERCGRNTHIALNGLGFPLMETPDKTIWRPHLHAIIRKGTLTTGEIASALRKETHTAKYQVDIQPFRANRAVGDNIQNIVRYCLKFRIERDYKRPDAQDFIEHEQAEAVTHMERNWWPAEDVRAYVDWLCVERSGFQSLRVVIGQAKANSADDAQHAVSSGISTTEEIEDGKASLKSISYRSGNLSDINQKKEGAVISDMNGIFVVEDGDVVEGNSLKRCMYNNIIQDTNWADTGKTTLSSLAEMVHPMSMSAINGTTRYAGNVTTLSEQLRSIMTLKQASDARRGDMM